MAKNINTEIISKGDYVDLGLPSGTKWLTCNLGASKPWEIGEYYAWGEIELKNDYTRKNYKYCNNEDNMSKYNDIDNKIVLDLEDDVVYKVTNGNAHTPSVEQIRELIQYTNHLCCECEICDGDKIENIHGVIFFEKYKSLEDNPKTMFIPTTGDKFDNSISDVNKIMLIMSNSIVINDINDSCVMFGNFDDDFPCGLISLSRYCGLNVRGVIG